jgi:hypothetical protein
MTCPLCKSPRVETPRILRYGEDLLHRCLQCGHQWFSRPQPPATALAKATPPPALHHEEEPPYAPPRAPSQPAARLSRRP